MDTYENYPEEMPEVPADLEDTRVQGYCWKVVDGDGQTVTYLTMDWSAQFYEEGLPTNDEIRIVTWESE